MAVFSSDKILLGSSALSFNLPDSISGKTLSLDTLKSNKATVIMFICNHCPYVKHVLIEMVKLSNEYIKKGVAFIAISSNDIEKYPEDSPQNMKNLALEIKMPFVYLFDESQDVARSYDAVCTPDFYVYDGRLKLVYHGQMDDSRPGNPNPNNGKDLRNALDCILNKKPVPENQKPSMGCSIKWK